MIIVAGDLLEIGCGQLARPLDTQNLTIRGAKDAETRYSLEFQSLHVE